MDAAAEGTMSQVVDNPAPAASRPGAGAAPSQTGRLASEVRAIAADLLGASSTRIVKMAFENDGGWRVEVEVFSPNPELTAGMREGAKAILERSRYQLKLDVNWQLVALEPVEG